jgi:hypothetical protein
MSSNLTPVIGTSGPASDLIEQIEAQGFKSHGKPLSKFAPWQRLKRVVQHMESAVNHCWSVVAEVRSGIKNLLLRQQRQKAISTDGKK